MDFALDAKVGQVLYDKLTLSNARGRLRVKDQRITLENFTFNTLGGEMGVTGFYETTTPAKPTFDVGLKMQKLDIPSAFQAFNTVRLLAPVAEYAKGNFSANLKLNGPLGKDMMPLYQALTGQGSLQTSKLLIQDFPALDKMASATKLNFLNDPTLHALRSQFAIRDGRLHLQPFTVSLGGTSMTVAGSNGLDQSLQYNLGLRVPRSLIGADANQAISGPVVEGHGRGRRSRLGGGDSARHPGRRHHQEPHDQDRSREPARIGGARRDGRREAGGRAAGECPGPEADRPTRNSAPTRSGPRPRRCRTR